MEIGDRIPVKTRDFKGMATILYIATGEIYPFQVELDKADSDGHKIYRIASSEIVKESIAEASNVTFTGPDDPQKYIGRVIQNTDGYSYEIGQKFVLGVVSYPGVHKPGTAKSFYIYEPENMRFRGCMPADMFSITGPFVPAPEVVPEAPEPVAIIAAQEYRQMSFLDFI